MGKETGAKAPSSDKAGYKLKFSQKAYCVVKMMVDFLIAFIAIIVLSPIFIIIAIAIKIDSKGPVFFCQKRIGRNGKEFTCIKFRSMSVKANHEVASYQYGEVNSYITKVGAAIRRLSIDELPQLFNVLTFKMSLISYRPVIPGERELDKLRKLYNIYQIRPGISGWAQINGRDVLAAQPRRKAQFDNYYLQHFSPWFDIKIFFLTIVRVFKKDGVQEGIIAEVENKEKVAIAESTSIQIGTKMEEKQKKVV